MRVSEWPPLLLLYIRPEPRLLLPWWERSLSVKAVGQTSSLSSSLFPIVLGFYWESMRCPSSWCVPWKEHRTCAKPALPFSDQFRENYVPSARPIKGRLHTSTRNSKADCVSCWERCGMHMGGLGLSLCLQIRPTYGRRQSWEKWSWIPVPTVPATPLTTCKVPAVRASLVFKSIRIKFSFSYS